MKALLHELAEILDFLWGIASLFLFVFLAGCLVGAFWAGVLTVAGLAPGR